MPLKLKLAANECLVVNGAVLVNGSSRSTLVVRNFAQIMREKDVLQEVDANTPVKRLYFLVQAMLMQTSPPTSLVQTYRAAHEQLIAAIVSPGNVALLQDVDGLVMGGDYYKALVKLHPLIAYEAELLNVPGHEWRRAPARPTTPHSTRNP